MSSTTITTATAPTSVFNKNRTDAFDKLKDKKNVIQNTFKTRLCDAFKKDGKCPYGSTCHYAHSESELRKTPCLFKGACKNKSTCKFDHSENIELPVVKPAIRILSRNEPVVVETTPGVVETKKRSFPPTKEMKQETKDKVKMTYRSKMCSAFLKDGKCPYNSTCHYAHTEDELRKASCIFGAGCRHKSICQYDHSENEVVIVKSVKEVEPFIIYLSSDDEEQEEEEEDNNLKEIIIENGEMEDELVADGIAVMKKHMDDNKEIYQKYKIPVEKVEQPKQPEQPKQQIVLNIDSANYNTILELLKQMNLV